MFIGKYDNIITITSKENPTRAYVKDCLKMVLVDMLRE